ncbi:MAG: class I SAM-dependent methyltransferase [Oscillospiraceae bacterium]|nr:class I SAM-dependent methyltransferase [Oscillospiraceae bacterium]
MSTPEQESVTERGNPRKPEGEYGRQMLTRMNESHAAVTEWGLSFLDLHADHRVLDIGCGGGAALRRMAQTVTAGHLTGADYSPVSVETAKAFNADAIAAQRMEIIEASVEALPFPDRSFDRIITVESFYFWPSPAENLAEVRRVLRPDGRFLLIADIYDSGSLPESDLENIRKYQLFNPTPERFRALFQEAGFPDIRVHLSENGKPWICVEARNEKGKEPSS